MWVYVYICTNTLLIYVNVCLPEEIIKKLFWDVLLVEVYNFEKKKLNAYIAFETKILSFVMV